MSEKEAAAAEEEEEKKKEGEEDEGKNMSARTAPRLPSTTKLIAGPAYD
jgi:hypothetical protein